MANDFNKRLKEYRELIKVPKKREMARKLGISEQLYYMLEKGTREPSKDVLEKLFLFSRKPEEYWLYGIVDGKELILRRKEFKCLKDAVNQLMEIGMLKDDENFRSAVEEVLIAAMRADVSHLVKKGFVKESTNQEEFKCLKDAINQLMEIGILKDDEDFSPMVEGSLISAMKVDVLHLVKKKTFEKINTDL